MLNVRLKSALISLFTAALVSFASAAVPSKSLVNVNDYAGVLTTAQVRSLQATVDSYKPKTIFAVVIVKDMEGQEIFNYSQEIFDKWGIGNKQDNNGILIVIALKERKIRIHTGYGMEATLPDHVTQSIIKKAVPDLGKGRYFEGLKIMIQELGMKRE